MRSGWRARVACRARQPVAGRRGHRPAVAVGIAVALAVCACAPSGTADPAPTGPPLPSASAAASGPAGSASAAPAPSRTASTPTPARPPDSESAPDPDGVLLTITIKDGDVQPSGQKLSVRRGQTVILRVTSDIDDELHAHTGDAGFELPVKAGETAAGRFVADQAGSFEVESHQLGKIIVIVNVR